MQQKGRSFKSGDGKQEAASTASTLTLPTLWLTSCLPATHCLLEPITTFVSYLLYVSGFDFLGEKFLSTSKLYGRDGKIGLTMHGIYPAPTLPDPLPC